MTWYRCEQRLGRGSSWSCSLPLSISPLFMLKLPVEVICERLDMELLWSSLPVHAEFINDLPVGMFVCGIVWTN